MSKTVQTMCACGKVSLKKRLTAYLTNNMVFYSELTIIANYSEVTIDLLKASDTYIFRKNSPE